LTFFSLARGATLAAVLVALGFGGTQTHAAGTLSDYRLLILDGQRAKWGSPLLGTSVSLTYAVVDGPLHSADAINCPDIVPLDGLLAGSRVDRSTFDRQVDAAFAAWAAVADIDFTRVADAAKADIVIGAQAQPAGHAFTNVALRQQSATRIISAGIVSGSIARSIICLNPRQAWKVGFDGNLNAFDLRFTLLHEIGHAIGLDHPDSPNAVMDYHYTEAFSTLQPGDISGVVTLYGPRNPIATVSATPPPPWIAPASAR
jgi:hypothetical protein